LIGHAKSDFDPDHTGQSARKSEDGRWKSPFDPFSALDDRQVWEVKKSPSFPLGSFGARYCLPAYEGTKNNSAAIGPFWTNLATATEVRVWETADAEGKCAIMCGFARRYLTGNLTTFL